MAWTLTGTTPNFTLTQTGTDANLSGLDPSNLNGGTLANRQSAVSVADGEVKDIYTVAAGTTLVINGTLTLSPYVEQLIMNDATNGTGNANPGVIVVDTGTFNIGATANNGVFDAAITAIEFTSTAAPWWSGATAQGTLTGSSFIVSDDGTLNWNGGAIIGPATYSLQGVCNIGGNAAIVSLGDVINAPGTFPYLSRFLSSDIDIQALNYVGGSISLGNGYEGIRASIDRFNGFTAYWPQYESSNTTRRTPVTIFGSSSLGNTVDFAVERNCVLNVENHVQGTGSRCAGFFGNGLSTSVSNLNAGHIIFYRTFETDVTDIFGNDVEGYVYMRDFNNNNRKNQEIAGAVIDDRADFVYDFPLDGSISNGTTVFPGTSSHLFLPERSIISGIVSAGGTNLSGATDVGPYVKDLRGFTTLNADGTVATSTIGNQNMRAYIWSYAENPAIVDLNLDDGTRVALNYTGVHTPDISTTQTLAAVIAAWSSQLTITAALLTVNSDISFDDLYDFTKYRKVTDTTLREVPSAGAMVLSASSGAIDLGATNLTLGGDLTVGTTNTSITTTGNLNAGGNTISGTFTVDDVTGLSNTNNVTLTTTSTTAIQLSAADATHTNLITSTGSYTTANEATLTGGTIGAVTIAGAGDIVATDTAFTNTNITSRGAKVFTDTTGNPDIDNSSTLTLVGNEWTTGSSIAITTGVLNINGGSYTTALTGNITAATTWNWNNMAANSINFDVSGLGGTGVITINPDATTLAEAQRWYNNLTTLQQNRFFVQEPVVNVSLTIEGITSNLASVRALGGYFVWKQGTSGSLNTVVIGASTTAAQLTLTRVDTVTDTFHAWYIPASPSASASSLHDYNYIAWTPSASGNAVLAPFEPDPTGIVVSGISTDTFASTAGSSLDANGRGRYTITEVASSFEVPDTLALGRAIWNTRLYIESVATATLDNDNRPFAFISTAGGAGIRFAPLSSASSVIELTATSQKFLTNVSNIRSVQLGTAPATFPAVTTASNVLSVAPLSDVSAAIEEAQLGTLQNQKDIADALPRVAIKVPAPVVLTDQPI